MAHEIEIVNGVASHFYVGQTPWHGLGKRLDAPPTVEEGIVAAGLDWDVGLKALYTEDGERVGHRVTYRKTDGKTFGVVGPGYTPLQNREAFAWFQPMLDTGEASLHTAGSLQEGRKVWALAKINKPALEIADGDTVERFVLLSNAHDGSRSVRVGFTPIRVVCANTLRMAHDATNEANKLIKVLHTKNVVKAIDGLREIMNTANAMFEATGEQYRRLAKFGVNREDMRKYVKTVLGLEKVDDAQLPAQSMAKIAAILDLAERGQGNNGKTLWSGYNGVTEYLGTQYGRTQDKRLDQLWFGSSAELSRHALDVALAMAS